MPALWLWWTSECGQVHFDKQSDRRKIAIMSDRPQTTRNKIMCIMNTDNAQIMFLDTPGIHKPQHKLGEYMVRTAESTLQEVDVVLFVVDATEKRGAGEDYILNLLQKVKHR